MTFRCRGCQQIGHLLSNCPQAKKETRRNKKQSQKPRGWQGTVNPYEAAEDEEEIIPPPNLDDGPIKEEVTKTIPKANNPHKAPETKEFVAQELMDFLREKIPNTTDTSEAERHHSLDHSDSNKDNPRHVEDTSLVLFSSSSTRAKW